MHSSIISLHIVLFYKGDSVTQGEREYQYHYYYQLHPDRYSCSYTVVNFTYSFSIIQIIMLHIIIPYFSYHMILFPILLSSYLNIILYHTVLYHLINNIRPDDARRSAPTVSSFLGYCYCLTTYYRL